MTSEAYLRRLGFDARPAVSVDSLRVLHRAHVERIPYDNLSIQLGRPDDVLGSAARAADGGRIGYCFQQNSASETLLTDLGFAVSRRHGHVWTAPDDQLGDALNHLILVASGLPTDDNPGGPVTSRPSDPAAIDEAHVRLSTAPDSPFRRVLVVQRREGPTCLTLRGCLLHEVTATSSKTTELTTYADWRAAFDQLALSVADVTQDEWQGLWTRTRESHEAWTAAGRP